jgi:catechol 2,3-dioxygenase-like lactoylglutathione lyase family enzyme
MPHLDRLLTNLGSADLPRSKAFYTQLFDFDVAYDSDWFVQLRANSGPLEMGLIARQHEIVPEAARVPPQGIYLTFVVSSVDEVFERAQAAGHDIIREPVDTFYGQRRLLLCDPDGVVVDVSAPIAGFQPEGG